MTLHHQSFNGLSKLNILYAHIRNSAFVYDLAPFHVNAFIRPVMIIAYATKIVCCLCTNVLLNTKHFQNVSPNYLGGGLRPDRQAIPTFYRSKRANE